MATVPSSILIIGSGEFGLTTALTLALRPAFRTTCITVVDRLPFPVADGSSIDGSRIVRADYTDPEYSQLCHEAQVVWRSQDTSHPLHGIGADGRYSESGLVVTGDAAYVDQACATVGALGRCELLHSPDAVRRVLGTGGTLGTRGYVNWRSGWADAEAAVRFLRTAVERTGRVVFETAVVAQLLEEGEEGTVVGVRLAGGGERRAELTVVAAGAWAPGLVDLAGRSVATGQVSGYLQLTAEEWGVVKDMPVVFNHSTGIFFIPQHNHVLKVARHAVGYINPSADNGVSTPVTAVTHPGRSIPAEAHAALRTALSELLPPQLSGRPFAATKMCWYNDTTTGDFIVAHHPRKRGLFLATGGNGHAFKFLPVLGPHIVDILQRRPAARFRQKWAWPEAAGDGVAVVNRDGSRVDAAQMVL